MLQSSKLPFLVLGSGWAATPCSTDRNISRCPRRECSGLWRHQLLPDLLWGCKFHLPQLGLRWLTKKRCPEMANFNYIGSRVQLLQFSYYILHPIGVAYKDPALTLTLMHLWNKAVCKHNLRPQQIYIIYLNELYAQFNAIFTCKIEIVFQND